MIRKTRGSIFAPKAIAAAPVEGGGPFWSVMIPTFNREHYLKETLNSVLFQDRGPDKMQICVVDNASDTIDVKKLIDEYAGSRVEYVRQPVNIGGIRNINSCISHARGRYIHVLHDDDLVLENFYEIMEESIKAHPAGTVFMAAIVGIDDGGHEIGQSKPPSGQPGVIEDFLVKQALSNTAPTQTLVIPRKVYEQIGAYAEGLVFTPDWEMAFRAASAGCAVAATIDRPIAAARWHSGSDSARIIKGTRHIVEMKMTIDELVNRLSKSQRQNIDKNKYSFPAMAATHYASVLKRSGNRWSSSVNLAGAFLLDPNLVRLKTLLRESFL